MRASDAPKDPTQLAGPVPTEGGQRQQALMLQGLRIPEQVCTRYSAEASSTRSCGATQLCFRSACHNRACHHRTESQEISLYPATENPVEREP